MCPYHFPCQVPDPLASSQGQSLPGSSREHMAQWEVRYLEQGGTNPGRSGIPFFFLIYIYFWYSSLIATLNAVIRDGALLPTLGLISPIPSPRNQTLLPNRDPDQALPPSASQKHVDKVSCNSKGFSKRVVFNEANILKLRAYHFHAPRAHYMEVIFKRRAQ